MYIEQTKLRKSLIETPELYTNNIFVDTMECTDITMGGASVFGQKGYKQQILNTSQMLDSEYLKAEQIYSFMMVPTDYVNSKINQIVILVMFPLQHLDAGNKKYTTSDLEPVSRLIVFGSNVSSV